MNKQRTALLIIALLTMITTVNAETLNLTQKDTTTWVEVRGGATATLTYPAAGQNFEYTLTFEQQAEVNYSLVYYKDSKCNPTTIPGTVTVIGSGTSTFSGISDIGSLPQPDDANANTTCNYSYPNGAKIWLIPSSDIDGINLTWEHFSSYLFEENIRDTNGTKLNGTSHLITFVKTVPPTPTPTPTARPSYDGGSTGGGGVITNENYANIAESDRQERDWRANNPVKYTLKYNVYEVVVTGTENENDITLKYEGLKDRSASVKSEPPGTVYKYFNLYSGSQRVKSAIVRFKSDKSPVLLYRYIKGNWEKQTTIETGRDATGISYESPVSGFSNFAIASIDIPTEPSVATPLPQTPITTTPTPTPIPIPAITASKATPGMGIIGILFVVFVVAKMYKFRKD